MAKLNLSHDPSEIIPISWFAYLLFINVENTKKCYYIIFKTIYV